MEHSSIAILISCIALFVSVITFFKTYRQSVITEIKNDIKLSAVECNKFIIPATQGHPGNTQEVSAILTIIIKLKDDLSLFHETHWFILRKNDKLHFVRYLKNKLHSSILELIKNKLPDEVIDFRDQIQIQQLQCRRLLGYPVE